MSRSVLTNKLTEKFNQDKVKGLALQVMMNNEATYDHFYGSYNEEGATPTENTLFGVASLTKSVTALGIMKLQDDNKLSVKDLVRSEERRVGTKWSCKEREDQDKIEI